MLLISKTSIRIHGTRGNHDRLFEKKGKNMLLLTFEEDCELFSNPMEYNRGGFLLSGYKKINNW